MPIYEYRCENDHRFEVMQRMADDSLETCTVCGAPVQRVYHPVAVHFKGSGFYNTDYGKRKKGGSDGSAPGGDSAKADSDSGSGSKDSGKSDSGSGSKESGSSDKKTAAAGD
jgi:putative FmdB family regulatory protein